MNIEKMFYFLTAHSVFQFLFFLSYEQFSDFEMFGWSPQHWFLHLEICQQFSEKKKSENKSVFVDKYILILDNIITLNKEIFQSFLVLL